MIRLILLLLICSLMVMCSCSKEKWEEKPTCQRVYSWVDFYNSDTIYYKSVEVFSFLPYQNYLCGDSLINQWRNTKVFLQGCERDGYEQFRYSVGNEISKPVIYKK